MDVPAIIPDSELPVWMLQARRRFDWGAIFALIISLGAALPFIIHADLPATNETPHAIYQSAVIADGFRNGQPYSRWDVQALNGAGAPTLNFIPPGMPYAAAVVDVLLTADKILAVRLVAIVAFMLAGSMTYVLVTQRVHAWAGIIAASAYVYSPYMSLTVAQQLGDIPQLMALALLPTVLWAMNRLLNRNQAPDFAFVALSSAALLVTSPTHWIAALLLGGVLVGIMEPTRQQAQHILSSLILGAALSAFYWLPAVVEAQHVRWLAAPLSPPPAVIDWRALFTFPHHMSGSILNPAPQITLGWVLPLGSIGAAIALWRQPNRFQVAFLLCGWLVVIAALIFSPAVWLLGIAVFCIAIGCSAVSALLPPVPPLVRDGGFLLLLIGILLHSIPVLLADSPGITAAAPSTDAQFPYQTTYGRSAVVLPERPLPVSKYLAHPLPALSDARLSSDDSRADNQISVLDETNLPFRYQINITQPTTVTLQQAYFPGWYASVNGESLSINREPDDGFVRIDLPADTNGTLTIRMGFTPARRIGWIISGLTLLVIVAVAWLRWRHNQPDVDTSIILAPLTVRIIGMVMLITSGGILYTPVRQQLSALYPALPLPYTALPTATDSNLHLKGYDIPLQTIRAGETLRLQLYWQADRKPLFQYQTRLSLRDPLSDRQVPLENDHLPASLPTTEWLTDRLISDRYAVPVPDDVPPGTYEINIALTRCFPTCAQGRFSIFYDADDNAIGATRSLTTIHIHE